LPPSSVATWVQLRQDCNAACLRAFQTWTRMSERADRQRVYTGLPHPATPPPAFFIPASRMPPISGRAPGKTGRLSPKHWQACFRCHAPWAGKSFILDTCSATQAASITKAALKIPLTSPSLSGSNGGSCYRTLRLDIDVGFSHQRGRAD
jgi:hypothetical protein